MVKCHVYLQHLTPAEKVPCLSSQILPSQRNCQKSSSFQFLEDASLPCAYSSPHASPSKPTLSEKPPKVQFSEWQPETLPKRLPEQESTLGHTIAPHPYRVFKPPPLEWPHDFSPVPFPESHQGVVLFNSAPFCVLHWWRNLLAGIQKFKKKTCCCSSKRTALAER